MQKLIIPEWYDTSRLSDDSMDFLMTSIQESGITLPIVVDANGYIISGVRRYVAAQRLGIKEEDIPVNWPDEKYMETIMFVRPEE